MVRQLSSWHNSQPCKPENVTLWSYIVGKGLGGPVANEHSLPPGVRFADEY